MRFRPPLLTVVVVAGLLLPAGAAAADETPSSTLTVQVVDEVGSAENDVCLRLYEVTIDGYQLHEARCPEPGANVVTFDGLPSGGSYKVAADGGALYANGWYPSAASYALAETVTAPASVVLRNPRAAYVRGMVRQPNGAVADWADVAAVPVDPLGEELHTYTDEVGTYWMKVFPTHYQLHFAFGAAGQWAIGSRDREGAATYDLAPGDDVTVDDTLLSLEPTANAVVRGTVTAAAGGAPVADACVALEFAGEPAALASGQRRVQPSSAASDCANAGGTLTAADGTYELLVGYLDSPYVVTARATDGRFVTARSAGLVLREGQEATVDLALQPAGAVTGTVVDRRTGKPLKGACPSAFERRQGPWVRDLVETCSDGRGHWRLAGLPAGQFSIQLMPSDGVHQGQFLPGAKTIDSAALVTVAAGVTTSAPLTTLPRGAVLRGRITDTSGKPVAGLDVGVGAWPERAGGPVREAAVTDSDGRYTITNIEQRDDVIQVAPHREFRDDLPYAWLWSGNVNDPARARRYSFDYDKKLTFNAVVKPAASLTVTTTSLPKGVSWVSVDAYSLSGSPIGFGADVNVAAPKPVTLTGFSTQSVVLSFTWFDEATGKATKVWFGGRSLAEATPIPVTAGRTATVTAAVS
ncbi:MAG: carboxypeptidase-like regulatory domain-containing protein [Kineosporiaceae bacterium]